MNYSVWMVLAFFVLSVKSSKINRQPSPNELPEQQMEAIGKIIFPNLENGFTLPQSLPESSGTNQLRVQVKQMRPGDSGPFRNSESSFSSFDFQRGLLDFDSDPASDKGDTTDVSCTLPGNKNACGSLTLYTCEGNGSTVSRSGANGSLSCHADDYARLERQNFLRCIANMSQFRSRFGLNQSIIGTPDQANLIYNMLFIIYNAVVFINKFCCKKSCITSL